PREPTKHTPERVHDTTAHRAGALWMKQLVNDVAQHEQSDHRADDREPDSAPSVHAILGAWGYALTASLPMTARSSAPCPCAIISSMRAARRGSVARGMSAAVSIMSRTSFRAIVSSKL